MAAKAAVAALSGKPVSASINIAFDEDAERRHLANLNQNVAEIGGSDNFDDSAQGAAGSRDTVSDGDFEAHPSVETESGLGQVPIAASSEPSLVVSSANVAVDSQGAVPEWFRKAQEKAKKPAESADPAYRSRYADAIDAAERERSARKQEEDRVAVSETEARIQKMREDIMSGRASGFKVPVTDSAKIDKTDSEGSFAGGIEVAGSVSAAGASVGATAGAAAGAVTAAVPVVAAGAASSVAAVGSAALGVGAAAMDAAGSSANVAGVAAEASADMASSRKPLAGLSIPAVGDIDVAGDGSASDAPARKTPSMRKKRSIALPNVGKALSVDVERDANAQDGEAAEPARSKTGVIRGLRSKLPSVGSASSNQLQKDSAISAESPIDHAPDLRGFGLSDDDVESQAKAPKASEARNRFASLPEVHQSSAPASVSAAGVVAADEVDLGATCAFQPYAEVYVAKADDQALMGGFAAIDEAAPSAELQLDSAGVDDAADNLELAAEKRRSTKASRGGYSNVPKSRIQGFLSRFSKGDERRSIREEHSTPQEWLDIDQDFDARSVGAARGGWESFRQDEPVDDGYADRSSQRYSSEMDAAFSDEDESFASRRRSRRWEGGSASREQLGRVSTLSGADDVAAEVSFAARSAEENVYRFRHPSVDVEVWFVALGSELAANGGMEAFMAEHAAELKGVVFVELEGLGAGDLAVVEKEGMFKPCASASRMRRYASKASAELGVPLARAAIEWRETTSAYAMRRGYQALHIIGVKDGKPAFFGQADDVVDKVDEETILRNADFVMELLKQI